MTQTKIYGWLALSLICAGCAGNGHRDVKPGQPAFDDNRPAAYGKEFKEVNITSRLDRAVQKAYFFPANSATPRPLVVSLHTWSGNYAQKDSLGILSVEANINYIHPDFRGPDTSGNACVSELAIGDIDDAIDYAIAHGKVDTSRIYVIGVSGGGYATLGMIMRSRHNIRKFSAWASISDLAAWYEECSIRHSKYARNILSCTQSGTGVLNEIVARQRSPLFWSLPSGLRSHSAICLYAGIYDGITGSVPITHSIHFYNMLLRQTGIADSKCYVSDEETLRLLVERKPLGDYGQIGGRAICLKKDCGSLHLVIFTGTHEMLTRYAFDQLLNN